MRPNVICANEMVDFNTLNKHNYAIPFHQKQRQQIRLHEYGYKHVFKSC